MRPLRVVPQSGDRPHLQVLVGGARIAAAREAATPGARAERGRDAKFREIYERWFEDVVGWLYALGAPMSDTEDLAQEIFLVVRRKLNQFDGGNLAGWLYRITQLTVRDHRRRAWFRNLVLRRQEVDLTKMPHAASSPARSYEASETRAQFQTMVGRMSEKLRTTFVLFEVEGYSGEEIARIQDIPLGTVWTRLHKARKEFWKLVTEQRAQEEEIR
ncbi:MAG TPA: sigma-70 family RNA polymerase sigma factor [Polyangia bacterium]|nr:sigma-70 family RNA polymerase sigma factor [Polyangia bacterium]